MGILGRNGEGKSTLIKLIAGENAPTSGTIIASEHLKVGYFSQHQVEYLTLSESPIWHLTQLDPQITTQDARNFLGSFGFHGDKVLEAIAPFSGGEKARLALALIVYQKPNLLLLDEPTNHLDIDMREAIAIALQSFSGAVLMVSHDASLLELCCDQFLLVAHQSLKEFKGDLEDYRQYLIEQNRAASRSEKSAPIAEKKPQHHLDREERKKLQTELRRLTKEIEQAEKKLEKLTIKIEEIEQVLGDPASYETLSPEEILAFDQDKNALEAESAAVEEAWLNAAEEREMITEKLEN